MGFLSWPNKALANMGFLKTNLVSNWRGPVEKKEGEKKRKRKRRWRSQDQGQKGMDAWILVWKLTLFMNPMRLSMNFHALMVILLPKSRVFARVSS